MVVRHPLFMLRDGLLVRPAGRRTWKPITKSSDEAVKAIGSGGLDAPAPYVYDVDGVEAKFAQFQFYQRLEQSHAVPWIHSGCRTPEDAMDTFFAGAEAVTIELQHMPESTFEELAGIAEGEIHLGITLSADMPRSREVSRIVDDHGLAGAVLLDEGGFDAARLESMLMDLRAMRTSTTLVRFGGVPPSARIEGLLDRLVAFPST